MRFAKCNLKLGIVALCTSLSIYGCSGDEIIPKNSSPKILSITSSGDVVGFGNSISLTAKGEDNDGDPLTYFWKSDFGEFSNNSEGASISWTAPNESQTYSLDLSVSDGKDEIKESILVDVIPAYNDFSENLMLNFTNNSDYSTCDIKDSKLVLKPLKNGYVGAVVSPQFSPHLNLPFSIETNLGLFEELEDVQDYYYISLMTASLSNSDKVLSEIAIQFFPKGDSFNWGFSAKTFTKSTSQRKTFGLVKRTNSVLNNIGNLNRVILSVKEDKRVVIKLNDELLYEGFALKEFVEEEGFETNWKLVKGIVGVSSGDNSLTIDKIAIK